MRLLFIYGQVASGKLTVARIVSERTGFALFHNHLIVDSVAAVFPFGSEAFVRLREQFWLDTLVAAAAEERSLVFTFAPEPTVSADFPERVRGQVEAVGGKVLFIELAVSPEEQRLRLMAPSRAEFGKLKSTELLSRLRADMDRCLDAMPRPALRLDTCAMSAEEAAEAICVFLATPPGA